MQAPSPGSPAEYRRPGRGIDCISPAKLGNAINLVGRIDPQSVLESITWDELETINLALGLEFNLDELTAIVGSRVNVIAIVGWGVGNARYQAEVDYHDGVQISLNATYIDVRARFLEVDATTYPSVRVSAGVTLGSRAGRSQATRSFPRTTIAAGASAPFQLPPFAQAINIFATQPAFYGAGAARIRHVGGPDLGFILFESDAVPYFDAMQFEDGVRFSEATRFIEITNLLGVAVDVAPMFTLNL